MIQAFRSAPVDQYRGYSFSRASLAYDSKGRPVAPHNAVFYPGKFGMGIGVWEGTTNLIPAHLTKFESWNTYLGSTVSITQGQLDPFGGYGATRIQSTGGTNKIKYYRDSGLSTPGVNDTCSLWIRNNADTAVDIFFFGGNVVVSKSQGWVRVVLTQLSESATNRQLVFRTTDAAHDIDVMAFQPQHEQKSFPTPFTLGNRAPETLTIPTAGVLCPTEGQVDVWVWVDDVVRRQDGGTNRIISVSRGNGGNGILLRRPQSENTNWTLETRNDDNATSFVDCDDSYTPDGWHLFTAKWSTTEVVLMVDGIRRGASSSPKLPSSLAANMYIGSSATPTAFLNTVFDDIRLRSEPQSDAETLADYQAGVPLPVDQYTTLKLDFDGPDGERVARAVTM